MNKIKCLYMRGGTSKGPFLDLRDLPTNLKARNSSLLRIMGSPDIRQLDGLGGATFTTSKVVMAQPSNRKGIDVDYLFAQVMIDKPIVDTTPTCGNMMSGVGHLAIERKWIKPSHPKTKVMIYNCNTKAIIEAFIDTPNGILNYEKGKTTIDGVSGTGAPVLLNLFRLAGGATGKLFPLGKRKTTIRGIDVSIIDAGNLLVLMKAEDFGLTGSESPKYFSTHPELMRKMEAIRLESGELVGMGDVSNSVLPKMSLLSKPRDKGVIKSQYFTPQTLHPAHAVSGAICIGIACKAKGTIVSDIIDIDEIDQEVIVEHPSGTIPVHIEVKDEPDKFDIIKVGTVRTVRKIMDGEVFY